MTEWRRYTQLERIQRLRHGGRELLGKPIFLTVKRDGENVSLWLENTAIENSLNVSSHNNAKAESSIVTRMKATPEFIKAKRLLLHEQFEYHHNYILYGELLKTISPTRIEPTRKHTHWILFDVWDEEAQRFLSYNMLWQLGVHYKIPVVGTAPPGLIWAKDEAELLELVNDALKWCKRHRREGIVGKAYEGEEQIFFKEKIDLPDRPKIGRPGRVEVNYPPMPEERILRALEHAWDEVTKELAGLEAMAAWKDRKITMPIVAKHLAAEAAEHCYAPPSNFYKVYIETPIERIRVKSESETVSING